jgi:hypothetical protein
MQVNSGLSIAINAQEGGPSPALADLLSLRDPDNKLSGPPNDREVILSLLLWDLHFCRYGLPAL